MKPFSGDDVQEAIKGLKSKGFLGLDDIPMFFYIEFWKLLELDVMAMFEEFCQGNRGMERINRSYPFLITKCQIAIKVEDFGPISLSNSIYIIITKVHAKSMREVIGKLVGPFKSSFRLGRQGTRGFMWKAIYPPIYP